MTQPTAQPPTTQQCAGCGATIDAADEGALCPACRAQREGAPARLADPRHVRLWGAFLVVGGVVLAVFGRAWVAARMIPVPWIGGAVAAFGVWPLLFPQSTFWRERVGRLKG